MSGATEAAGDVATTSPALTIAVPASASEVDLAATLASLHVSALRCARPFEIVVGINGPEDPSPALAAVQSFAASISAPLVVESDAGGVDPVASSSRGTMPTACVRVLRLAARSKIAAWNAVRAAARAPLLVFADADVRVAPDALPRLVAALDGHPDLVAAAAREVATVAHDDGFVARLGALPYRFEFANIPGRLYALRAALAPPTMPDDVIADDGWLTVVLGQQRFVKDGGAIVFLRPPTTWRDYWAQRVRHELGKLQLARDFADLRPAHRFGRTPWHAFVREIGVREYPLVIVVLAVRLLARVQARRVARDGFAAGWGVLQTTKRWPAVEVAASPPPPSAAGV